MNIFKTMAVANLEEASRAIPVIDFGPALRRESGGLERVAREVGRTSETVGFFYLAGHPVPQAVIDDAFQASREFHAIPLDEKLALKINENNIGYLPVNQSMQRHSTVHKATRPNFNESFFISHDRDAEHPDIVAGTPLRGRNQWPAGHERMRATMVRYMKAMEALGEWLAPPVIAGTFLVNLGNIMKRWSNDRFLSTPHGVVNDSGRDRYSIAFFYSPNVGSTIECLPSCVSADNPARYPRAVYRDLILEFYNANYFHRKDYVA